MSNDNDATSKLTDHVADIVPIERAFLGAYLREPIDRSLGAAPKDLRVYPLEPDEFALRKHSLIWSVMLALRQRGEPIDQVLVGDELRRRGTWDEAGGNEGLVALVDAAAIADHVPYYAQRIREACSERRRRELGQDLAAHGFDSEEIQRRLRELPGPLTPAIFDAEKVWNEIEAGWQAPTMRTGLRELDRVALGLQPGDFLVVGARTSMGKTGFIADLGLRLSRRGVRVEILSLEESRHGMERRLVANLTGIPTRSIREGHLSAQELQQCRDAAAEIATLPLGVTDLQHLRSLDERHVVGAVSASDAAVIGVDHLQKVQTRGDSRVYGLERVCNELHGIALRDGRIVILTAQLNRESEKQQRPPMLADLRDSGGIEILARLVWLLYWPCVHDGQRDRFDYEVYVAKQGESGTEMAPIRFDARCGRFSDHERPPLPRGAGGNPYWTCRSCGEDGKPCGALNLLGHDHCEVCGKPRPGAKGGR